jgi:hypothetical protein
MNAHPMVPVVPGTVLEVGIVRGDLALYGWDRPELSARGADEQPEVIVESGRIQVSGRGNVEIHAPRHVSVRVHADGHVGVRGLDGATKVLFSGGTLALEDLAAADVNQVAGDLDARDIRAELHARAVGGDVAVDRVAGDCLLDSVGGNLAVAGLGGALISGVGGSAILFGIAASADVTAGGDMRAELDPRPGATYHLSAGGDLSVRLAESASAEVRLTAGGEIRVDLPTLREARGRGIRLFPLGQGGPQLHMSAGGDASLGPRAGEAPPDDERETVMRLLEIGRIDSTEADALLAALAPPAG